MIPISWARPYRATVQPRLFDVRFQFVCFSSYSHKLARGPVFSRISSLTINNNGLVLIFGGPPLSLDLFSDFTTRPWRFSFLPSLIDLQTNSRLLELLLQLDNNRDSSNSNSNSSNSNSYSGNNNNKYHY